VLFKAPNVQDLDSVHSYFGTGVEPEPDRQTSLRRPAFMRFLEFYRCSRLENKYAEWHFTIQQRRGPFSPALQLTPHKERLMLDIAMLALGLGFFVVAVGYTYACERL
jgi:hypothetical protein